MKTETKVILGVVLVTLLIILGGIMMFDRNTISPQANDYSRYIDSDLDLDPTKIYRDYNPQIKGIGAGTDTSINSTSSTSTVIYVTEFLDYECPACATNGETLTKQLLERYGERMVINRKIFPVHGQSSIDIASIVLASQIFGAETYEQVHKKVFETQQKWAVLGKKERENYVKNLIVDMGIDYDKLFAESKDRKYADQIMADKQDAMDLGIKATPSFIINNNVRITGGLPLNEIIKYIDTK